MTAEIEEGVRRPSGPQVHDGNVLAAVLTLHADVRFDGLPDGIELRRGDNVVTLTGVDPGACRRLLDRLDGEHPVGRLVELSGLDRQACETVLTILVKQKLAEAIEAPPPYLSGERFAALCREQIPAQKQRLFGHSLWQALSSGSASSQLFNGWLLEQFHFIEGVTLRLSTAAYCSDPTIRRHFIKHFREEYDHCEFFRKALAACGLSDDDIAANPPLAATIAVLDWMRDAARVDPLAYAACSGFLESTGADRKIADSFFEQLAKTYPPQAVKLMARHTQLDEDYGHGGFLEIICQEVPVVDGARAERALQSLFGFVETLELWSTAIERHYNSPTAFGVWPLRIYGADCSDDQDHGAQEMAQ